MTNSCHKTENSRLKSKNQVKKIKRKEISLKGKLGIKVYYNLTGRVADVMLMIRSLWFLWGLLNLKLVRGHSMRTTYWATSIVTIKASSLLNLRTISNKEKSTKKVT